MKYFSHKHNLHFLLMLEYDLGNNLYSSLDFVDTSLSGNYKTMKLLHLIIIK